MFLSCACVYHHEVGALSEKYAVNANALIQRSWIWSNDPFVEMIQLEEQHTGHCKPTETGMPVLEEVEEWCCGLPPGVMRIIRYYTATTVLCWGTSAVVFSTHSGSRVVGGALILLPPLFFLAISFLRVFKANDCHMFDKDVIFRYFRHRRDDKVQML